MLIKSVRQQYSLAGIAIKSLLIFAIAVIAVPLLLSVVFRFNREGYPISILMTIFCIYLVYAVVRHFRINKFCKTRNQQLAIMSAKESISSGQALDKNISFVISSIDDQQNVRNKSFSNQIKNKDWTYADYSYDIYKSTRNGSYLYMTEYYSVITVKLPRRLPHVLFDSKSARKRQFKSHFASAQIQSLEGNFDNYFATYFPIEYHIDGRSLISPEVMLAILEAKDYDIEIVGDQLFLFGDLRDAQTQIPDMAKKILNIKDKLLNNLVTYRDERIPYSSGRESVSTLGARLAINLTRAYILMGVTGILLVPLIIVMFLGYFGGEIHLYAITFLAAMSYGSFRKIRKEKNRRRLAMTNSKIAANRV